MAKPKFKIGEVVYLNSSASLGKLEAYRISSIFNNGNTYAYKIDIKTRAPSETTIGDRIDGKRRGVSLSYTEGELLEFCDAVEIARNAVATKLDRLITIEISRCSESSGVEQYLQEEKTTPSEVTEPKFEVGDKAFLAEAAKIGFREDYTVTNIHRQPNLDQWVYELDIYGDFRTGSSTELNKYKVRQRTYFFKESELLTECEALDLVILAMENELAELDEKLSKCS